MGLLVIFKFSFCAFQYFQTLHYEHTQLMVWEKMTKNKKIPCKAKTYQRSTVSCTVGTRLPRRTRGRLLGETEWLGKRKPPTRH